MLVLFLWCECDAEAWEDILFPGSFEKGLENAKAIWQDPFGALLAQVFSSHFGCGQSQSSRLGGAVTFVESAQENTGSVGSCTGISVRRTNDQ
jgi:hypothetical protein